MTKTTYTICPFKDLSLTYIHDGEFTRFFGLTKDNKLIQGIQSGLKGEEANVVRFDETLDVEIYEVMGANLLHHRPNLIPIWS